MLGIPAQDIHSTAATPEDSECVRVAQHSGAARWGVRELIEPPRGLTGIGKSAFVSRGTGRDPAGAVTPVAAELDEARSLSFWDCGGVFADGKWLLI
jgi:hypothetical protein